jgi:hypothetical protein
MGNVLFHQLYVNQDRMNDQLNRMDEKLNRMDEKLNRMDEKLDRVELQVSALVENAYRLPRGCEFAEVQSVAGAVRLMCDNDDAIRLNSMIDRVVDWIYREGTRLLLKLIRPDAMQMTGAGPWEVFAYDSLQAWDSPEVGESGTPYHVGAQEHVVSKFKQLLKPFQQRHLGEINTPIQILHGQAKEVLKHDSSGLSLSLIMAHPSVQQFRVGKSFAWRVLDIDGYKTEGKRGIAHTVYVTHEVKSSRAGLVKAKDQLRVRAGFLDAMAAMMQLPHGIKVHTVAAIMREAGEIYDQAGVPVSQSTDEFEKISELFLTIDYFRL